MNTQMLVASVAVEAATYAIDKPYEYAVPSKLCDKVVPGVRVRVGFGRGGRRTEGIVLDVHKSDLQTSRAGLKPIISVIDETPILEPTLIKLGLWLREQYFCTFFDAAKIMIPSGVWHKIDMLYTPADRLEIDAASDLVSAIAGGPEMARMVFRSAASVKLSELVAVFDEKSVKKVMHLLVSEGFVYASEDIKQKVSDKTERFIKLAVTESQADEYVIRKKVKTTVLDGIEILKRTKLVSAKELCYFTGMSVSQLNTLKKNGIVEYEAVETYRRPRPEGFFDKREIVLNEKQNEVYEGILSQLSEAPACALLHGVTGSGKTLVYFKLIEKIISMGKTAILLVPEISLTPQLLRQVYAQFGERTAVMHSALSSGERYDEWKRIRNGEVDVVVGTRSAIFSPLKNIGIIILDEEQEDTYKSSSNPRYHAREVAKFRCVSESALLLLGSATPSVESMYYAKTGRYKLFTISERFNERPLPKVIISDARKNLLSGKDFVIGKELYNELAANIEKGEQSILFLNRRGASKYAVCSECEVVPECPNCSVPLVFHSKNMRLMCHHCGFSKKAVNECESCGSEMKFVGSGTQRVEQELTELFPNVEMIRMDMDTTTGKTSHEKLLNRFRDEKIPILLGTQMITKGLDFENVTLVGVISADQAMFNENFKASENAFSLITQVVGRAGRGSKSGRAVIQTYSPKNALIEAASKQDYDSFFDEEIKIRKNRNFPPFSDIFSLVVMAENELGALQSCMNAANKIKAALDNEYADVDAFVFGPAPASIIKVNGKYRYKLSVCTKNTKRSRDMISRIIRDFVNDKKNKGISIIPDINSTDF